MQTPPSHASSSRGGSHFHDLSPPSSTYLPRHISSPSVGQNRSRIGSANMDPDSLLADLSAAHEELLLLEEEQPEEAMPRGVGLQHDDDDEFSMSMDVSHNPVSASSRRLDLNTSISGPSGTTSTMRDRTTAILFAAASSQGNSGLLSVSPRSVGPSDSALYGYVHNARSNSARGGRVMKRHRSSLSSGDSIRAGDGTIESTASDSMVMLGPGGRSRGVRAGRESLPGNVRARRADGSARREEADLLRYTHTRNLGRAGQPVGGTGMIGIPKIRERDGLITPDNRPLASTSPSTSTRKRAAAHDDTDFALPGLHDDDDSENELESGIGYADYRDNEEEEDLDPSSGMIARMRTWRHDAILQHLYETAAFWGDKIFSWTGEPNDAFWLAQTYFLTGHYVRAEKILLSPLPPPRMPNLSASDASDSQKTETQATMANIDVNGKSRAASGLPLPPPLPPVSTTTTSVNGRPSAPAFKDDGDTSWVSEIIKNSQGGLWGALSSLTGEQDEEKEGDVGVASTTTNDSNKWRKDRARMVDWSMPCRYLAALAMIHQEKFTEALDLLGESNPFKFTGKNGANVQSKSGELKIEASICRLRGVLYLRLNSLDAAKESYMEALALDVRNYDVFNELVNEMMSPEEEWDFIQSLSYREQLHPDDAEFVRLIYTSRLSKTAHAKQISKARQQLVKQYNLGNNSDVLVAAAENLFTRYRYEDCHTLTSKIIATHPGHPIALPLHLACLAQIPRLASSLFMIAHKLVEDEPTSPVSWYAVGLWYFIGHRWSEARRYFAATHDEDTRFGPAWITFAHCFAFEGEHESAITAYSTTARLFPGSYFPHLCIGMEHLQLNNAELAAEAFNVAYSICQTDPLLLNELGVSAYNRGLFQVAIDFYELALGQAEGIQGVSSIWTVTHCNLGHSYRRLGIFDKAKVHYNSAIRLDTLNVTAYTSLGMIAHLEGDIATAVERYHHALAIAPQDAIATVLLELALPDQLELGSIHIPGIPKLLQDPTFNPLDPNQAEQLVDISQMPVFQLQPLSQMTDSFEVEDMSIEGDISKAFTGEGSTMDIED